MLRPRRQPVTTTARALREFLSTEVAGGVVLLIATVVAMAWANSPWSHTYEQLWHTEFGVDLGRWSLRLDLLHWVNDGLMALFFLVVGMEVKRELMLGELRERRRAALPVAAAIGGMVVPAVLYLAFNSGGMGARGWGIPMATDIAFAVGVLALVAPGLPPALRLFLLSLAIVDDIGAIVVIAVFYSGGLNDQWALVSIGVIAVIALLRGVHVTTPLIFAALGVTLWVAVHATGVHATLAGVVMGLLVPATPTLTREIVSTREDELRDVSTPSAARTTSRLARQSVSELEWLEHSLHPWTSLFVVPLFALANAGIEISAGAISDAVSSPIALGVVAGLVVGKPVGILAGAWLACRAGFAELSPEMRWRQVAGVAALGGIGFTVSLFITQLAFDDPASVAAAKAAIVAASILAALFGSVMLRSTARTGGVLG